MLVAPPPDNGPKRFTFRIRRRGFSFRGSPSLLIGDYLGVWSVTSAGRACTATTSSGGPRPRQQAKIYKALVRERGMDRWPQFKRVAGESGRCARSSSTCTGSRFTEPVGTGPVPVWAGTKPAQIQNLNLNSKKIKKFQKIPKNTLRCDEFNGVKFSQKFVHLV